MGTNGAPNRSVIGLVAAVVAILALSLAYFLTGSPPTDEPESGTTRMPGAPAAPPAEGTPSEAPAGAAARPGQAAAPRIRIEESGRLSTTRDALREGDALVLGLALSDVARGEAPIDVKVVDVRGRRLDVRGVPVEGTDAGLRLEIDPDWLEPSRYLIELETIEKKPLALRRYVLEITGS